MTFTHAIVYVGAPYGEGESGHIISRHTGFTQACKAWAREISGTAGVLNHQIVKLDEAGNWDLTTPPHGESE